MAKRKKSDTGISKETSLYYSSLKRHTAIQEIVKEFLCFTLAEKPPTDTDIQNREHKINNIMVAAGGSFDTSNISTLFYLLEEVARQKISEVTSLAQTSDPDKAKELIPNLPDQLVNNVKLSREDSNQKAFTNRAKKGAEAKEVNRSQDEKDRKKMVYGAWSKWKASPHLYKNRADFADTVLKTHPDLSRDTIYKKWVPNWEKEYKSQHPS